MTCSPTSLRPAMVALPKASACSSRMIARPGLVQNCPRSDGKRPGPTLAQLFASGLDGFWQNEHRIDRAQLAKERNGLRARNAEIIERLASPVGASEADGLDQWMLHKSGPHIAPASLHKAEDARMHAAFLDRCNNSVADQSRRCPDGRYGPLTTTGQPAARAAAVSPPATEKSQREIGCSEHRDRSDRALHEAQIWAWVQAGDQARLPSGGDPDSHRHEYGLQTCAAGRLCGPVRLQGAPLAVLFPDGLSSVISAARASISSAMHSRKLARSLREE